MCSTTSISSTEYSQSHDELPFSEGETCHRRRSYWALINNTLYYQFPRFVNNLRNQSVEQCELGRAMVLEFREGENAVATHFKGSEHLEEYLNDRNCQKLSYEKGIRRRLWVLEDLSRNYVEVLGSGLCIPPSFFAAQWADPIGADFNERDTFVSNSRRRFLLRWPQFYRVTMAGPARDVTYAMTCNVERHLSFCNQEDITYENPFFARSYHSVSYWSVEYPGGSWDAVLLVDPPITKRVMVLPTRELQELNLLPDKGWHPEKQPPYPTFTSPVILEEDYRKWAIPGSQPAMMSMFDDLKFLQDGQRHAVTEDPRSCTSISRKIVISMWIAFIRRRFLNLLSVSTLVSVHHSGTDFLNRASWTKREWNSTWHWGIFSNLVNARFKLDILRSEATGNLAALGLTQHTLNVDQDADVEEWEKAGWESVIRLMLTVQQMEIIMQSYSQAASIQEAKTSNDLTRSVNRITALATVLLPISVISGVFSMNGDFAIGAVNDWMFWATTGPVLALTAFLLFTNTIEVVRGLARRIFSRRVTHELPLYRERPS